MRKIRRFHEPGLASTGVLALVLFGIFLVLASLISAMAALTVLWPHGVLVSIWSFKETEYHQLLRVAVLAGWGFAILSFVLALTAVGWFLHQRWAWFSAVLILAVNLISDVAHLSVTKQWVGVPGALVEGLILFWLLSRPVRIRFTQTNRGLNEYRTE